MDTKLIVTFVFFILAFLLIVFLAIKEIFNMKDLRSTFTCKYCNTLNTEIKNGHKCIQCNRVFSNTRHTWEHYLIFRISKFDTYNKKLVHVYKDYLKYSKIELAICIVAATIMLISILMLLFR